MSNVSETWFSDGIRILTYNRNQRVWSIIVTLFGDLAQNPGDRISGAVLSRITEPMGIKPEAMRVALHRLRGDGWIVSERDGRISHYSLTADGLKQSRAASPRIYARQVKYPDRWQVCVANGGRGGAKPADIQKLRRRGFLQVNSGVFLAPADTTPLKDSLVLQGHVENVPVWLCDRVAPAEVAQAYDDLNDALDRFSLLLRPVPHITPLQAATLRTILVHVWRRALFSHADLPPQFFSADWKGPNCRAKVLDLLDRIGRPELAALEQAV